MVERINGRTDLVVRGLAVRLVDGMKERAPQDTGVLRANFQVGLDEINTDTSSPAGSDPVARATSSLENWRPGQTIYMTNSMPYAVVVEYGLYGKPPGSANGPKTVGGFSKQSVGGFARLTAQNVQQEFAAEVRSLK